MRSYAELRLEDSPALPPADLPCRAVPCFAVPGQPRAGGQGWMLPGLSVPQWARRKIAPAKVVSGRGSRNNTSKQEVISRGKRFNGSVTWHCTKNPTQGGCRQLGRMQGWRRCVGGCAVPCRARGAHGGAVRAEPGAAATRPALSRRLKVVLF